MSAMHADTAFLDIARVTPAPAAVTAADAAARARGPVVPLRTAQDVQAERSARPAPPLDERAEEVEIPAPDGSVTVRVIAPPGPARAVRVTAHASGWCLSTAALDDLLGGILASGAGIASVSVDYRLAPEHPFPAGLDDVTAALTWTVEQAGPRFGTDRVLAAGASAGAHLSLLALLRLREQRPDLLARIAAADLRYGCYDLGQTPSLRAAGDSAPIVTSAGTAALLGHALPGLDDEQRRDPSRSPLYADLHGLPPVLVSVGDRDGLLDDSMFLATRLAAAGVPAALDVWQGCTHVFDTLDHRLAGEYATRLTSWLAGHTTVEPGS